MKSVSVWVILIILFIGSCRNDSSIGPSDLLLKRWHLYQTRRVQDNTWVMYDMDAYYDTEYRSNGMLVYRRNGIITEAGCCRGSQFERSGVSIQYNGFIACPLVRCSSTTNATITILKDNLLELQTGDLISQYTPAN